jgi:hypothetical protein
MRYLVVWCYALHGRSGVVGMGGPAPVAHAEILAFAALHQVDVEPWEADVLIRLDAAMMATGSTAHAEPSATSAQVALRAWPARKGAPHG